MTQSFEEPLRRTRTRSGGWYARATRVVGGGLGCDARHAVRVFDLTGDAFHDRCRRVAHRGTYNAAPITDAAGLPCLQLVATRELTRRADTLAERLRADFSAVLDAAWSRGSPTATAPSSTSSLSRRGSRPGSRPPGLRDGRRGRPQEHGRPGASARSRMASTSGASGEADRIDEVEVSRVGKSRDVRHQASTGLAIRQQRGREPPACGQFQLGHD